MAIRNFATRMSCFSLISSIETDLRNIIYQQIPEDSAELLPEDVVKNATQRYLDHKKEVYSKEGTLDELLEFVDFYDLSKILNKIKGVQQQFTPSEVNYICGQLEALTRCRNRVCHSRPLEANDFSDLLDFTYELIKTGERYTWSNINEAIRNLDNPAFALSLEIPEFWKTSEASVYHNLPLPEFDDTGFMGRDKDRSSINKLLTSNTKVISIVGEGGVGKTALAQRCMYDILEICEDENFNESPYEIIAWVTLKTNRLTVKGADQIRDAISTSAGLFNEISQSIGGNALTDTDALLAEITEYMSEFSILLCIDNLETISSNEVRDFLANIPSRSKVIITTRIGLGEIEYRYKLDKLDDKPSVELMRNMSLLLNIAPLFKKKNEALKQLCIRLYNNPLLIKWYVLAVAAGSSPADLINKTSNNFKDALRFCFENLYDQLGEMESKVISVIACLRKPVSAVELRFILGDIPEIEIEEALHKLNNSSMLTSSGDRSENKGQLYSLTGVAEEYINSVRPVSGDVYSLVKSKRKELQYILDQQSILKNHYRYDVNSISWATRDEKICSIYLKKALVESKKTNTSAAEGFIQTAKEIMPEFSECYRIHGLILKDSAPFKADSEFEKAVDINPDSVISRYAYAQFLIHEEDFERAEIQIDQALKLDPEDNALKTCKAWILTLQGSYRPATVIYEELIPNQKNQLKKFRISTYDQAASCYRRMAEQYIRDNDLEQAHFCLERSVQIIRIAIEDGDYDHGTIAKLMGLLTLTESHAARADDDSLLGLIFDLITNNYRSFNARSIQALAIGLGHFEKNCSEYNSRRVSVLKSAITPADIASSGDRIMGTIIRTVLKEGSVSFGFIDGADSVEYFFHRSELSPEIELDQTDVDVNVTFVPSENDKGQCALNIRLYNPQPPE